ncbi:tachykinin family protein [Xylaria palmicola]|nr:tachykinin family protein [Xylaria palmicola]
MASEAGDVPISYTFVTGDSRDSRREGRSHAIRAHWRQRRQRIELQRRGREEQEQRPLRTLLPGPGGPSDESGNSQVSSAPESQAELYDSSNEGTADLFDENWRDSPVAHGLEGIPAQALSGMNIALGTSRLDPFDRFPVQLTPKHHRLLHHWLATFAGMMFSAHTSRFNPMRDVWLPLDLSNAASFSAIMAHSAAHLARMQGCPVPRDAVRFKVEAVGIVQLWARDPARALDDDTIAAILRLLSFERYWGSEDEWRIHHHGLLRIIEVRGGIATLQSNWRLGITVFLATLMTRPSWFDSSNQLREISQQPLAATHPVLGQPEILYKARCLWLLSFIQDMRNFMSHSSEMRNHGLVRYAFIRDALLVVRSDLHLHDEDFQGEGEMNERERIRLACLFYICVVLQGSISPDHIPDAGNPVPIDFHHSYSITHFDQYLAHHHAQWHGSSERLFNCVFYADIAAQIPPTKLHYALDLTNVLGSTSPEARHGVERCMLQILCQALMEDTTVDYDWTPDSLLACIEGS